MAENHRLPLAAVERILRKSGSGRVSDGAAAVLAELLEGVGSEIARAAREMAAREGRKTVKGGDVRRAAKEVWE